jgi:hypothetical protein
MKRCTSCNAVADIEICSTFSALTALDERAIEKLERSGFERQRIPFCVSCLIKTGAAIERGDFAGDPES